MTVDEALHILRNHWCYAALSYAEAMQVVGAHVEAQAAQIEALTKAAERYRALRHAQSCEPHSSHTKMPVVFTARDWAISYTPHGLDEAMDYVIEDMAASKAKEAK